MGLVGGMGLVLPAPATLQLGVMVEISSCLSVCPIDHLLGGLPAGGRAGLAQEALCLPGVRDAADGQTLRPGQRQPPVHHLQPEQGLSGGSRGPAGSPRSHQDWGHLEIQQKEKVKKNLRV